EGGAINEEIRVNNARDRTEAYGTVFLGLTVGCAVCHDHKFDPITQKDFYALSAFFNNLAERPSNDDRFDPPPTVRIPKAGRLHAYNAILTQKAQVLTRIRQRAVKGDELVRAWLAAGNRPREVASDALLLRFRFDEQHGVEVVNSAPSASQKTCTFTGVPPVWGEETWLW